MYLFLLVFFFLIPTTVSIFSSAPGSPSPCSKKYSFFFRSYKRIVKCKKWTWYTFKYYFYFFSDNETPPQFLFRKGTPWTSTSHGILTFIETRHHLSIKVGQGNVIGQKGPKRRQWNQTKPLIHCSATHKKIKLPNCRPSVI